MGKKFVTNQHLISPNHPLLIPHQKKRNLQNTDVRPCNIFVNLKTQVY